MITNADLKNQSRRDLADFAKQLGLTGFQSMRKEELVDAIRKAQRSTKKSPASNKSPAPKKTAAPRKTASATGATSRNTTKSSTVSKAKPTTSKNGTAKPAVKKATPAKAKPEPKTTSPGKAALKSTAGRKTNRASAAVSKRGPAASAQPRKATPKGASKSPASNVKAKPATTTRTKSSSASGATTAKERTRTSALKTVAQTPAKPASATSASSKTNRPVAKKAKGPEKSQRPEKPQRPEKVQRPPTAPKIVKVLRKQQADAESRKDLSVCVRVNEQPGKETPSPSPKSDRGDRVVLIVRDSYWLQVCWEIGRSTVERARAAMAADWHAAVPVIRLMEVGHGSAINSAETLVRDIPIHGGVNNWYIDVDNPPARYRVLIGYRASTGRFYTLCRSNIVQTPAPGACDPIEGHWEEIAEDYERIYSLSEDENGTGSNDLREMFEERLQRPMPDLSGEQFAGGSSGELGVRREKDLPFEVDAELIIFGSTTPGTTVMLGGKPVRLTADGSFTVRMELPDRRQVIPVVASSRDGMRQRTTVVAVERNTKVMEPVSRHNME